MIQGLVTQMQVLKGRVGCQMGSNPLLLREMLLFVSSPLIVVHCTGGGVYGKIVSASPTHFDVGFFSSLFDV